MVTRKPTYPSTTADTNSQHSDSNTESNRQHPIDVSKQPSRLPFLHKRSFHIGVSWIAVILMALFICWMSSNTGENINSQLGIISTIKMALASLGECIFGHTIDVSPLGHFLEYCVFGILLCNALRFHIAPRRAVAYAFLLGSLYGVTDELHQALVPTRSCDPMDWLVDTVAALVGGLLMMAFLRWRAHVKTEAQRESFPHS